MSSKLTLLVNFYYLFITSDLKLTLLVNFYYLFITSDLKVKTNIVLERGICVITHFYLIFIICLLHLT